MVEKEEAVIAETKETEGEVVIVVTTEDPEAEEGKKVLIRKQSDHVTAKKDKIQEAAERKNKRRSHTRFHCFVWKFRYQVA
jgi:succinyl-CoA synthetase beta subunit